MSLNRCVMDQQSMSGAYAEILWLSPNEEGMLTHATTEMSLEDVTPGEM